MSAKTAVACRIEEICTNRGMAINTLAHVSNIPPSTVYSMLNEKSQNPGIVSIEKICIGLEISLRTFFDSPLFDTGEVK